MSEKFNINKELLLQRIDQHGGKEEFCKECGVSLKNLDLFLNGNPHLKIDKIYKILKCLGLMLKDVLDED